MPTPKWSGPRGLIFSLKHNAGVILQPGNNLRVKTQILAKIHRSKISNKRVRSGDFFTNLVNQQASILALGFDLSRIQSVLPPNPERASFLSVESEDSAFQIRRDIQTGQRRCPSASGHSQEWFT
jgi:hypothetical protein